MTIDPFSLYSSRVFPSCCISLSDAQGWKDGGIGDLAMIKLTGLDRNNTTIYCWDDLTIWGAVAVGWNNDPENCWWRVGWQGGQQWLVGGSVDRIALFLFPRHLIPSGKVDTIKKSVQRRIKEIRVTSLVLFLCTSPFYILFSEPSSCSFFDTFVLTQTFYFHSFCLPRHYPNER